MARLAAETKLQRKRALQLKPRQQKRHVLQLKPKQHKRRALQPKPRQQKIETKSGLGIMFHYVHTLNEEKPKADSKVATGKEAGCRVRDAG